MYGAMEVSEKDELKRHVESIQCKQIYYYYLLNMFVLLFFADSCIGH